MSRFTVASFVFAVAAVVFLSAGSALSEEWLSGTGKLYVDPDSTKVGIGTDDPQAPLVVEAPVDASALFQNPETGYTSMDGLYVGCYTGDGCWVWNWEDDKLTIGSGNDGQFAIIDPNGGAALDLWNKAGGTNLRFTGWPGTATNRWDVIRGAGGLVFRDAAYEKDVLALQKETGYVGIGTISPQSELAVNGTITAKEVIVTTSGWPDYVFDAKYSLPSLDNVESYIEENKHLPDVPSAKEVEKNGLAMSEMLAKQMQKIEELTLYLIEMKKENEEMKGRIAALEEGK